MPIANLAQMVNVIAPIFTNPDGLFLQTIYHPLRLYAEHAQDIALDPTVVCETYDLSSRTTRPSSCGASDRRPRAVQAAGRERDPRRGRQDPDAGDRQPPPGRRRSPPPSSSATVHDPPAVAYEVHGDDPTVLNSFERPDAVTVQERD